MILDNLIAVRILYLLVTPFEKQEAFKLGVIDKDGNPLMPIDSMDQKQKSSYTMLHRLVFRLKKVLGVLPFGKTNLASIAAAYVLVRECTNSNVEFDNLEEVYKDLLEDSQYLSEEYDAEIDVKQIQETLELLESITNQMKKFGLQMEDPVSTTGGIPNTPVIRRKQSKKVAIFDVKSDVYQKFKKGKQTRERWDRFLNLEDESQAKVKEYIKKNPNGILVLRCSESGEGQVIRYRKLVK